MAPQRYEAVRNPLTQTLAPPSTLTWLQVNSHDHDDDSPISPDSPHPIPNSPPPSFRSRASSPTSRRLLNQDPLFPGSDRDHLEDTFDDGEDSDAENDGDDRQRLMRGDGAHADQDGTPSTSPTPAVRSAPPIERRVTELPAFRPMPQSRGATDGVFANLSAKPEPGQQLEEKPPVSPHATLVITPAC
jgi:hypothetical protein